MYVHFIILVLQKQCYTPSVIGRDLTQSFCHLCCDGDLCNRECTTTTTAPGNYIRYILYYCSETHEEKMLH